MKNIVLIGMPGCGKSTFGAKLAQQLGRDFLDADQVLEEREQRTIKSFFAESEDCFRAAETRTLEYLAALEGIVLATGGGAIKKPVNMELLAKTGVIIFIDRKPENIIGDIKGDARPLLAADKQRIFNLYEERIELYRKYAQYTIDNNGDFEAALAQLQQLAKGL